jgi:hypothetical protein
MTLETKLKLTAAGAAALAMLAFNLPAKADPIFDTTKQFTVNGTNSPDSFSNPGNMTGGSTLDGGALQLTTTIVPTGLPDQSEWIVFHYQTTDGALSQPSQDWSLNQLGVPVLVPVDFIGDFTQFSGPDGPLDQTVSIFHQTLMSNPVPGGTGNGEGTLGFSAAFPAGPLGNLGAFTNPFSQVTNAFGTTDIEDFTQALEFKPQTSVGGVPEPSTWTLALMGFGLMAFATRFARKRPSARIA